ncbi:MAG: SpoIID/LytB domain-containing protein, partial [Eubacteriales bacterium]|nr:SpoIID/LytB domain-containing protein [Eubacteriales bacterium]
MKRYLLYFLCFFICVILTPTVYSLMPEGLKPEDKEAFIEQSETSSLPDTDIVKLYITADGTIEEISLEDYVAGVLFTELPSEAPYELLKTMAIVIRT